MPRKIAENVCTDVDFLELALEESQLRAFGGVDARGEERDAERGVAGIQALKLCVELKAQLDAARRLAGEDEEMTDDEVLDKIREELPSIPDAHLVLFVAEYCDRHHLPIPHRVLAGGQG